MTARRPREQSASRAAAGQRKPRAGSEDALIALLTQALAPAAGSSVQVGIGDDAAVLNWQSGQVVVSVDAQVEGTHFKLPWLKLADIGFRSFQAAISDLAAMGAEPVAAVAHLTLPRGFSAAKLRQLVEGQRDAALGHACPIVGGNLSRGPGLSVVTTVFGRSAAPLLRGGARAGDEVWLLGEIGLARAGLLLLSRGTPNRSAAAARARAAWRRPVAQVAAGKQLVGNASSAIDLSDGLARDAAQLARMSQVQIQIERSWLSCALPRGLTELGELLGEPALELGLRGGEDYALLATGAAQHRPAQALKIGRVVQGSGAWLSSDGSLAPLGVGFDHFAKSKPARRGG
jgi:thiamine-monophosphate kinase